MTAIPPSPLTARALAWPIVATYVVVSSAALAVSFFLAPVPGVVARAAVGLLAVGALLLGARRSARIGTNPWLCFATATAIGVAATTVRGLAVARNQPLPRGVDVLELAAALVLAIGVAIAAHLRSDPASRTAALDALVLGSAAVLVSWVGLLAPNHNGVEAEQWLTLASATWQNGILVAVVAWIALAPGRRSTALQSLTAGVAFLLASHLLVEIATRFDRDLSTATDATHAAAYVLLGLAGLLATGRIRESPTPEAVATDHVGRSALIGVALLTGPLVAVTGDLTTTAGMVTIGVGSALLAIGVVGRFVNLIHRNEQAHARTATSERRFRMLADSAPVGIFELGRGLRVTYANSEGRRLLGPGVLGGSVDSMLENVDESSHPRLRDAFDELAEGRAGSAEVRLNGPAPDQWITFQSVPVLGGDARSPMAFASTLDITELKQAEAALARQATHDPLTGLPNRRQLLESLIDALSSLGRGQRTGTVALMFIDLDGFKLINDVHGHDRGDALLITASARLRNAVRSHDVVARFGGDEFVILLQHVSDRGELHELAQRILDSINAPINVGGESAHVGASIGIATASGPDDDPDALIRNADAAMYRAKEHGRGRYEFFRPEASPDRHRML